MSWDKEDDTISFNRAANESTPDDKGDQIINKNKHKSKNKNGQFSYTNFGINDADGILSNTSNSRIPPAAQPFGTRRTGNVLGSNASDAAMNRGSTSTVTTNTYKPPVRILPGATLSQAPQSALHSLPYQSTTNTKSAMRAAGNTSQAPATLSLPLRGQQQRQPQHKTSFIQSRLANRYNDSSSYGSRVAASTTGTQPMRAAFSKLSDLNRSEKHHHLQQQQQPQQQQQQQQQHYQDLNMNQHIKEIDNLVNAIELTDVYFGLLHFCKGAKLTFMMDKLVISPRKASSPTSEGFNPDLTPEIIKYDDISRICYAQKPNNLYIAIEVLSSVEFNSIAVGTGFILDPDASINNSVNPTKYIVLTAEPKSLRESHIEKLTTIVERFKALHHKYHQYPLKQRQEIAEFDAMIYSAHDCSNTWVELEGRIQGDKDKQKRNIQRRANRERRRHHAELEVDPTDGETYAVYPPYVESVDPIVIYKGDLKRLADGEYWNDALIDLMLRYTVMEKLGEEKRKKVHAFSCLLYTKLVEERRHDLAHALVARWTKIVDLFDQEFVLIPLNHVNHWSLLVVIRPGILAKNLALMISNGQFMKQKKIKGGARKRLLREGADEDAESSMNASMNSVATTDKPVSDSEKEDWIIDPFGYDESGNRCCIIHLDSLGMHNTKSFSNRIKHYLYQEWRTRKFEIASSEQENRKLAVAAAGGADSSGVDMQRTADTFDTSHTAVHLPVPADEIDLAAINNVFLDIQAVKCKGPMQQNGYDCGVFVTKYAEDVLDKWPASDSDTLQSNFGEVIRPDDFTQQDITARRNGYGALLKTVANKWAANLEEYYVNHPEDRPKEETKDGEVDSDPDILEITSVPKSTGRKTRNSTGGIGTLTSAAAATGTTTTTTTTITTTTSSSSRRRSSLSGPAIDQFLQTQKGCRKSDRQSSATLSKAKCEADNSESQNTEAPQSGIGTQCSSPSSSPFQEGEQNFEMHASGPFYTTSQKGAQVSKSSSSSPTMNTNGSLKQEEDGNSSGAAGESETLSNGSIEADDINCGTSRGGISGAIVILDKKPEKLLQAAAAKLHPTMTSESDELSTSSYAGNTALRVAQRRHTISNSLAQIPERSREAELKGGRTAGGSNKHNRDRGEDSQNNYALDDEEVQMIEPIYSLMDEPEGREPQSKNQCKRRKRSSKESSSSGVHSYFGAEDNSDDDKNADLHPDVNRHTAVRKNQAIEPQKFYGAGTKNSKW